MCDTVGASSWAEAYHRRALHTASQLQDPRLLGIAYFEDGYYVVSSYQSYDGAHIGKHRVTVTLDDTNPAKCPHSKELILEVVAGSNKHDIELSK